MHKDLIISLILFAIGMALAILVADLPRYIAQLILSFWAVILFYYHTRRM